MRHVPLHYSGVPSNEIRTESMTELANVLSLPQLQFTAYYYMNAVQSQSH